MSLAHRDGSPGRMPLKEKFVDTMEAIFKGEDPSRGRDEFWDELLLLKINHHFLHESFESMSEEHLLAVRVQLNMLFQRCVDAMDDSNEIRVAHSLALLGLVMQGVFRKRKFSSFNIDVVNVLMGFDRAEEKAHALYSRLQHLINSRDTAMLVKAMAMKLLTVIVTATSTGNNLLIDCMKTPEMFQCLVEVFRHDEQVKELGSLALLLLSILALHRKYEAPNCFAQGLAEISDDVVLSGLAAAMTRALDRRVMSWISRAVRTKTGLLHAVSSMLVGSESEQPVSRIQIGQCSCVLLCLYQLVYNNPHFSPLLGYVQVIGQDEQKRRTSEGLATPTSMLSMVLTCASFLMHAEQDESNSTFCRLSFLILTCMTEDEHANAFLHDSNVKAPLTLYRAGLRHRVASAETKTVGPMASAILDLCVEFLITHMKRNLDTDLYRLCLDVIHRLLCHEKKHELRLHYSWGPLWSALLSCLKFLNTLHDSSTLHAHIFEIASKIMTVFNLFITYGDTFLPDPRSYDELYYELIRESREFAALFEFAKQHMRQGGPHQNTAARLAGDLVNIRSIIGHFSPKIDALAAGNKGVPLTPDQVLGVVRDNYDTLILKLQDSLDVYEHTSENPNFLPLLTRASRLTAESFRGISMIVDPIISIL